jgi:putative tryptophan/tyrosine transport system substrate-binding protein
VLIELLTPMNRRAFVTGLGAMLAAPLAAEGQQGGKVPRIGYVTLNTRTVTVEAFEQGLRQSGYVLGQNIVIDYRFAEGHPELLPALVNDLLRTGIDVLFAANPHAIRAAVHAKATVPIVGIDLETDPVRAGWVKTLARPGGNVTGFFLDIPELSAKQVQFLVEAIPRLQRVAIAWDAEVANSQFDAAQRVAHSVKIKTESLPFRRPEEFPRAFETAQRAQVQALIVLSSPVVFAHLRDLAGLALKFRFPAISIFPQFAEAGGLMGYGPNVVDLFRRAARYVDQIIKGAKPSELPIQRPVVLDFAVNLKTAKALGLTIPPSLLLRADQLIE